MKGLLIVAASLTALSISTSAFAADAVDQIPAPPVATDASSFTWDGFYLGGITGYGWGTGKVVGLGSDSFDGWRLGGFTGYNWQFSNGFVAGVEGDLNYDWSDKDYGGGTKLKSGFSGSARARAGYAIDHTLIYAAGGWTATNAKLKTPVGNDSDTLNGWTIGAGVDHAFTDKIFGRVEYRYNDFGRGDLLGTNVDFKQNVVQVGVGVKF
ncbi:porin family protein (plasmid) [Rhizobium grahamii]|uniref:Porin family protein n=1 Tax=Rhizobium grahamii TaxID=1120045 RepID=A0A5Q0CAR3_9HYPH|nr:MULTISPECIES: outer membrane protein [Rhizobium]QFY62966.1 porin family protein [Rhizobium grahamii]QRM52279.1 porin family protein [Rhizobium sp. BG6]